MELHPCVFLMNHVLFLSELMVMRGDGPGAVAGGAVWLQGEA